MTRVVPEKAPGTLRIVGWNVAGSLPKKFALLEALKPDIAVLSEACNEARLLRAGIDRFSSASWIGRHPHKGQLILGFGKWRVKMLASKWDQRLEWIHPVQVSGPMKFTLFGVWSQNASAGTDSIRYPSERHRYPFAHLLEAYERLLESDCLLMGDFNHHSRWDKGDPTQDFSPVVERYRQVGLSSAWHAHHQLELGDPSEPATHWWQWNREQPYMLDYCFLPSAWVPAIRNVWVGGYDEYGASDPRSDHAPLVVDIDVAHVLAGAPLGR